MPFVLTVLVADDEEVVLNFVTAVLKRAGFRVLPASGGVPALRLANRGAETIHLAVLDVVMPEMDGPATCAALREYYPRLPILFMSGYDEDEVYRRCGGPLDFMKKPFTPAELLDRVRRAIELTGTLPA